MHPIFITKGVKDMLKYLLLIIPSLSFGQSKLEKYYSGDMDLTKEQIIILSNDNVRNGTPYQKSLGHYQLAVIARGENKNLTAWKHYDEALILLSEADTTDYILESSILRNQGAIAKNYKLHEVRAQKYIQAIDASIECDRRSDGNYINYNTRGASTLYNLGRAYKDSEELDQAIQTFVQLADKVDVRSKYRARAFRESAMIFKKMEMYDTANYYFELAADVQVSSKDASKIKMWVYHDWASLYREQGMYQQEEKYLTKALSLKPTFRTKLDLGECLYLQGRKEEALAILIETEKDYKNQRVDDENIRIYDLLLELSDDKQVYAILRGDEYKNYAMTQNQVKEQTTSVAFMNAINELKRNRLMNERIAMLKDVLMYTGLSLAMFGIIYLVYITYKKRSYEAQFKSNFKK